jgi:hypothetical protein
VLNDEYHGYGLQHYYKKLTVHLRERGINFAHKFGKGRIRHASTKHDGIASAERAETQGKFAIVLECELPNDIKAFAAFISELRFTLNVHSRKRIYRKPSCMPDNHCAPPFFSTKLRIHSNLTAQQCAAQ